MFRFRAKNIFNGNIILNNIFSRHYAFKSDLKIKWLRPEKIPFHNSEKTGDLEGIPFIDQKQLLLEFRNSKEMETVNENVRRLFTLEFAPKCHQNKLYFHELVNKVKSHEFDTGSAEVKIAKWTGIIRALQEVLERFPRNKKLKVYLKELIELRKKHLKYLRRWDYKKFEWLLENLNIVYKPPPSNFNRVTRKESLQKLTNKYCNDIKQQRFHAYRLQLENEQPAFLQEKIRALNFIREEQKKCGVNITIAQEEIETVKKQLDELKKKADSNNT